VADRVPLRSAPRDRRTPLALGALGFLLLLAGCAKTPESQEIKDSWEPVNRPVFSVNRQVDDHALGPVARGWRKISPGPVRDSISNAYRNLTFPARFVSTVGQAEGEKAGTELARFLINSTVGLGGLFDPASKMGLERHDETIGKMFARWGIPPGPYMVVPLLGPSTPRDAVGGLVGVALNPLMWVGVGIPGIGAVFAINGRAQADEQIEAAKRASLDYYVFARDAYIQNSAHGGNWWDDSPLGPSDDLYEIIEVPPAETRTTETDLQVKVETDSKAAEGVDAAQ
jgi:phospholipid-binding lipoprotein MlaA